MEFFVHTSCGNQSCYLGAWSFICRSFQKFCVWFYCNNNIQVNKHYCYSWKFTHMSSSHCNHPHCPHTFPIYFVNDQLQICIQPFSDNVEAVTAVLISLPIQTVLPKMFSHTCKQPVITCRVGRNANTSQPQCCTRFCTSNWWCGVTLSWSKMTQYSSSSSYLWQRASLTLSCNRM